MNYIKVLLAIKLFYLSQNMACCFLNYYFSNEISPKPSSSCQVPHTNSCYYCHGGLPWKLESRYIISNQGAIPNKEFSINNYMN